ncbi:MAG TPA: hypothetical protein VER32_13570 [Pyrinomonadaceae bacterium]|nr:hypothetical protein [Pyrinomonadaceae bacterium]
MLGLGNIFSGVFGKFFDSIGMGWMTNVLSLTANIMSGNWVAAAKDVFDLVARFSDSDWMNRVASLQPLGEFDFDGCFGTNGVLSEGALGSWISRAARDGDNGFGAFFDAVSLAQDTLRNNTIANAQLQYAQFNTPA